MTLPQRGYINIIMGSSCQNKGTFLSQCQAGVIHSPPSRDPLRNNHFKGAPWLCNLKLRVSVGVSRLGHDLDITGGTGGRGWGR